MIDNKKETDVGRVANEVRRLVLEHVVENNGGYLSQACSSAEILSALYVSIMNLGPSRGPMVPPPFEGVPGADNPDYDTGASYNGVKSAEFDRFIFSPSHYALVLYSVLVATGRMDKAGLLQFNRDGSRVEMIGAEHSPGIETTTGSLGQALSQAGGIALARKLKKENGKVWVFMTDGELQEGQTWEAFQALRCYGLDNIGIIFDMNAQQCDGPMCDVMDIGDAGEKLRAFGATVCEVDGHNVKALFEASTKFEERKPLVILAKTDTARGMEILRQRGPKLHYVRFSDESEKNMYREVLNSWKS